MAEKIPNEDNSDVGVSSNRVATSELQERITSSQALMTAEQYALVAQQRTPFAEVPTLPTLVTTSVEKRSARHSIDNLKSHGSIMSKGSSAGRAFFMQLGQSGLQHSNIQALNLAQHSIPAALSSALEEQESRAGAIWTKKPLLGSRASYIGFRQQDMLKQYLKGEVESLERLAAVPSLEQMYALNKNSHPAKMKIKRVPGPNGNQRLRYHDHVGVGGGVLPGRNRSQLLVR